MHVILALIWLLLAALVFVQEASSGPLQMRIRLGGANLSIGWIMLALAGYNLARWYSTRLYRQESAARYEAVQRRYRRQRDEPPSPPAAPDPNFQFTQEPAPPGQIQTPPEDRKNSNGLGS
jgi:hypothetical protein